MPSGEMRTAAPPASGNLGTWKSGNLEIWEFGDLGTWKSRNLEIWGPGNPEISVQNIKKKMNILKIRFRSAQNVGRVWISRKKIILGLFGAI